MSATDQAAPAIQIRDLHKSFGSNEVLRGIDFHVDNGEVVCVIGPSGSGKSTLLRCVNRLEEPDSGQITADGRPIASYGDDQLADVQIPNGVDGPVARLRGK